MKLLFLTLAIFAVSAFTPTKQTASVSISYNSANSTLDITWSGVTSAWADVNKSGNGSNYRTLNTLIINSASSIFAYPLSNNPHGYYQVRLHDLYGEDPNYEVFSNVVFIP